MNASVAVMKSLSVTFLAVIFFFIQRSRGHYARKDGNIVFRALSAEKYQNIFHEKNTSALMTALVFRMYFIFLKSRKRLFRERLRRLP